MLIQFKSMKEMDFIAIRFPRLHRISRLDEKVNSYADWLDVKSCLTLTFTCSTKSLIFMEIVSIKFNKFHYVLV